MTTSDSLPTALEDFDEAIASLLEIHLPSVDYSDERVRWPFLAALLAAEALYPLEPYLEQQREEFRRGIEELAARLPAHRAALALRIPDRADARDGNPEA